MEQAAKRRVTDVQEGLQGAGWEDLVRRDGRDLRRRVARELRRMGGEDRPEEVEELAQEVYCRLLAGGRPRALGRYALLAYVQRVAVSVVVDHLREEGAAKRGLDARVDLGEDSRQWLENTPHRAPDPEERLLTRERRWLFLSRCCRHVGQRAPRRTLCILALAFFADWRSHEIASALGGKPCASSIDSLVHRIKEQLTLEDRELLRG